MEGKQNREGGEGRRKREGVVALVSGGKGGVVAIVGGNEGGVGGDR